MTDQKLAETGHDSMNMSEFHDAVDDISKLNSADEINGESSENGSAKNQSAPDKREEEETVDSTKDEEKVPIRFLRAEKGDAVKGMERYKATLEWRKEHKIDEILYAEWKHFDTIKENWPHYFHLRGKKNEPVYYEMPPKMKIAPMKKQGLVMNDLLHHYRIVTEFMWQYIESSEEGKSIYVMDLDGMRIWDFAGEIIDFCRQASKFTQAHYPERAGTIFVINPPGFFQIIWNVMKPLTDPVTLEKVKVVSGKDEVHEALKEKIDIENIPPYYGGTSMPLGEAPEEKLLVELIHHNNALHNGEGRKEGEPPSKFSTFKMTPLGGEEFALN